MSRARTRPLNPYAAKPEKRPEGYATLAAFAASIDTSTGISRMASNQA